MKLDDPNDLKRISTALGAQIELYNMGRWPHARWEDVSDEGAQVQALKNRIDNKLANFLTTGEPL